MDKVHTAQRCEKAAACVFACMLLGLPRIDVHICTNVIQYIPTSLPENPEKSQTNMRGDLEAANVQQINRGNASEPD